MKKILRVIRIILLAAAFLSAVAIAFLVYERGQADATIQILREQVEKTEKTEPAPPQSSTGGAGVTVKDVPLFPAALQEQNADLAAWLTVPGTAIDYPVMLTPEEPEYYLHRDFNTDYSRSGTPFMDALCSPAETADSLIIYGHNMRDGSMFSALKSYESEDFYLENPSIALALPGETRTYRIFAALCLRTDRDEDFRLYDCVGSLTQSDFDAYVDEFRSRSLFASSDQPVYGDKLIILSTCSYHTSNERLIVVGWQQNGTD